MVGRVCMCVWVGCLFLFVNSRALNAFICSSDEIVELINHLMIFNNTKHQMCVNSLSLSFSLFLSLIHSVLFYCLLLILYIHGIFLFLLRLCGIKCAQYNAIQFLCIRCYSKYPWLNSPSMWAYSCYKGKDFAIFVWENQSVKNALLCVHLLSYSFSCWFSYSFAFAFQFCEF